MCEKKCENFEICIGDIYDRTNWIFRTTQIFFPGCCKKSIFRTPKFSPDFLISHIIYGNPHIKSMVKVPKINILTILGPPENDINFLFEEQNMDQKIHFLEKNIISQHKIILPRNMYLDAKLITLHPTDHLHECRIPVFGQ